MKMMKCLKRQKKKKKRVMCDSSSCLPSSPPGSRGKCGRVHNRLCFSLSLSPPLSSSALRFLARCQVSTRSLWFRSPSRSSLLRPVVSSRHPGALARSAHAPRSDPFHTFRPHAFCTRTPDPRSRFYCRKYQIRQQIASDASIRPNRLE